MTDPAPEPVRVLIVDDDPLLRAGLTMMLAGAPELAVVAEAQNGREVAPMVRERLAAMQPG